MHSAVQVAEALAREYFGWPRLRSFQSWPQSDRSSHAEESLSLVTYTMYESSKAVPNGVLSGILLKQQDLAMPRKVCETDDDKTHVCNL